MDARTAAPAPLRAETTIEPTPSAAAKRPGLPTRQRLFLILGGVIAAAALIVFLDWLFVGSHHVTTDDAYVDASVAQVTPLVSGPVISAPINDTLPVKQGDVLVTIDPTDFKIALEADEAALGQARRRVEGYFASRDADSAMTAAKGADVDRARSGLASAQADLDKAQTDLSRREALARDGAVSGDELTIAQNRVRETEAALAGARAALAESQASQVSAAGQARAMDAMVAGADVDHNPEVAAAQAKVDQARLDLERTVIRAPIDGVIAKSNVEVGQRVEAGTQLMTVVPIQAAYVNANFKEDQVRRMRLGQPVVLTSDVYGGGVKFHGRIVGLAGGTGSAFAVIPAQNATGNWIKVVQRLPVRIELDPAELKRHPLRVGLSMTADVDVAK